MEDNPYAPPKAVVADAESIKDAEVRFFGVSPVKLVLRMLRIHPRGTTAPWH